MLAIFILLFLLLIGTSDFGCNLFSMQHCTAVARRHCGVAVLLYCCVTVLLCYYIAMLQCCCQKRGEEEELLFSAMLWFCYTGIFCWLYDLITISL